MTRRDALVTIAAVAARAEASPVNPVFSAEEMGVVARLADIIIPRTDTPGAVDAGVHLYIEHRAGDDAGLAYQLKQGIAALRRANFIALPEPKQIDLFVSTPLFATIKDMTIDGYYSSREGLVEELGYHGDTFVETWEGCTHPEHQWDAPHAD